MRTVTDADSGKGQRLRLKTVSADKGSMVFVVRENSSRRTRRRDRESGQALVEFALILPLFLMIVVGVIQFGVALNFWLDMQRLANQGARSAAVNCGPAGGSQCGPSGTMLEDFLGSKTTTNPDGQVISSGNTPYVDICYVPPTQPPPGGWTPSAGDAVRVELKEQYRLQAVVRLAKIDLAARATMRLEQSPTSTALPSRTDQANWVLATHTGTADCQE